MQEAEKEDFQQDPVDSYFTKWKSWPEIRERLLDGEASVSELAKWLQATEPEARDRNVGSLERNLRRIRQKLKESGVQAKLAELQRKVDEAQANADGSKKTAQYIDVLDSLGDLFTMQMERIRMGRELEGKVKYLLTKLTADFGEAREILKFMFEVQQELGLAKRRPIQFEGKMAVLTLDERQKVVKALELVKQRVLAKQLESKVVQEAAEEVIEQVVSNENGMVIDVEPTDPRLTRSYGEPIPIADELVDPKRGNLPDLPWED